jgi:hypothetical protein
MVSTLSNRLLWAACTPRRRRLLPPLRRHLRAARLVSGAEAAAPPPAQARNGVMERILGAIELGMDVFASKPEA